MTKKPTIPLPPPPCPPLPDTGQQPTPHIPAEGRDEKGRILPGFGGRKPGSRNKQSRETVAAVQALAPEAVTSLRTLVRQLNWQATRYVLDQVLPAFGRGVELENSTPEAIITAMSDASISPTEAAKLATAMSAALGASELRELRNQVDELEQLIGALKR